MAWRICLVDDDSDILTLVSATLAGEEFELITLSDPTTALEGIQRAQPDLVILDIEMPRKSGLELCSEIREKPEFRQMPIVFLTSRSEPKLKVKGMEKGAIEYIMKPFRISDLLLRIRAVLAVAGNWKGGAG
ncbi:MAG TPA: response regulator [Acidobacteriota bacterium]|jgi:DNA-binding response OmpR family regulator